jgi:hypothetical protein
VLNFPIKIEFNLDDEAKELLKELNEHLSDLKVMIAPVLGWRVKKTKEKKDNNG